MTERLRQLLRRPRYRWRTWGRVHLPDGINLLFLGQRRWHESLGPIPASRGISGRVLLKLVDHVCGPGPKDCRAHEWYNANGAEERCYHCQVGKRPIRPQWRNSRANALRAARELYRSNSEFRADVDEELAASGGDRDTLLIMLWHAERAGDPSPRRAHRHQR